MRTIGIIGGMSWHSSKEYYRIVNEEVNARMGGLHSAKCILYSVDIAEVIEMQDTKGWGEFVEFMKGVLKRMELAGADCIVICTNTVHRVYDELQSTTKLPIIHVADATGKALAGRGIKKVGLLGTRLTMVEDFYKKRLKDGFGIETVAPEGTDVDMMHDTILGELCLGVLKKETRKEYLRVIDGLISKGAGGIILGCTEIPLLIKQEDVRVPIFDTAKIHALAAVDFAMKG